MTKRPLLAALAFLILGIILGRYAPWPLLFAAPPAALAAALYDKLPLKRLCVTAAALSACAALGYLLTAASLSTFPAPVGQPTELAVTVKDVGRTHSGKAKALVKVDSPGFGGMVVMLYGDAITEASPKPGDWLTLTGELQELSFRRNPGGYDEFMYLRSRKAQYKMFPETAVKTGGFKTPADLIKSLREPALNRIARLYPGKAAGVMQALLVGDQTALDDDLAALYQDAGIYHILAVSGLHVSIVALALNWLLKRFGARFADISTLALLLAYTVFTGCGAATVRSALMASLVILAGMVNRRSDVYGGLSAAGLALLLYEPLYLWDAGFLYSFTAILGAALLSAPVERLAARLIGRAKPRRLAMKYVGASLSAILATLPVSMFFFYKISVAAVLTNALLLPTVLVTVAAGFVSLAVPPAAYAGRALLWLYQAVCELAVKLPFAVILTGRPPLACVALVSAALLLWALMKATRFKAAAIAACAAASLAVFVGARAYDAQSWRVTMLDVGQGDSTAFAYHGRLMLIDGGGNFFKEIGDNTGKWVGIPFLNYSGVHKADAAFLTHEDADHALGLIELLEAGRIKTLYIGDIVYDPPDESQTAYADGNLIARVLSAAEAGGAAVEYVKAGDRLTFAGGLAIDCLYPPQGHGGGKTNNQSLVMRLTAEGVTMLFTGDAEDTAERRVLALGEDIHADVLKVGHHGSKTSSTQEFIAAVSPQAAIIGVSATNNYGHPNPMVVSRIEAAGAKVYTTAQNGAITLTARNGRLSVTTMGGEQQ